MRSGERHGHGVGSTQPSYPWGRAALVVLGVRVAFFLLAFAASFLLSGETHGLPDRNLVQLWERGDAVSYLDIAQKGYESEADGRFFPLLPVLVGALTALGIPPLAAGLLVVAAGSWVAVTFLYVLAASAPGDGRAADHAALYLVLSPVAVLLVAPYPAALVLAGALPALHFARQRRWLAAGAAGAVASAASLGGASVALALAAEAWRRQHGRPSQRAHGFLAAGLALLPVVGFSAYLWRAFNAPGAFLTTDGSVGRIVALGAAVVLAGWAAWMREWGYAVFMGALLAAAAGGLGGLPPVEAAAMCFPAAILVARATRHRRVFHDLYLMLSVVLAALGVVAYTRGSAFF